MHKSKVAEILFFAMSFNREKKRDFSSLQIIIEPPPSHFLPNVFQNDFNSTKESFQSQSPTKLTLDASNINEQIRLPEIDQIDK